VPAFKCADPFPGTIANSPGKQFAFFHGIHRELLKERRESEGFMFETPEEVKQKEPRGFWIGIVVVVAVVAVGAYFFVRSRDNANRQASAASTPAAVKGSADPVHDLKIQRATMNKDRNGTMAVWLVTIKNKSQVYSYSKIAYETTYVGADNNAILINKGTIPATIGPGEQNNAEINDALYPAGTSWYKIRITGATPAAQ